ncbi:MAG: hypothetical protein HY960_05430 [Ignavibacteriae bacterium]|nr:hypothetical protein [Ignavibacteriota bacterium]
MKTVFAIALVLLFVGCNPNQWGTKEVIDGSSLQRGEQITIEQHTGETTSGEFLGTTTLSPEQYQEYYVRATQQNGTSYLLPIPGEQIRFATSLSKEKLWEGTYAGFDEHSLKVKFDENSEEEIYLSSITKMSGREGEVLERMRLRSLFQNGEIPIMTAFVMKGTKGDVMVPLSSIKALIVHPSGNGVKQVTLSGEMLRNAVAQQ